jgi:hypothetical protein
MLLCDRGIDVDIFNDDGGDKRLYVHSYSRVFYTTTTTTHPHWAEQVVLICSLNGISFGKVRLKIVN